MPSEDHHLHLKMFMEVCDAFRIPGVPADALRIKLFPFSLRDKAQAWLNTLPTYSVISWTNLGEKFLLKFFPPTKNDQLREDITGFRQQSRESTYEAWERFKDLLRKCPQHGIRP